MLIFGLIPQISFCRLIYSVQRGGKSFIYQTNYYFYWGSILSDIGLENIYGLLTSEEIFFPEWSNIEVSQFPVNPNPVTTRPSLILCCSKYTQGCNNNNTIMFYTLDIWKNTGTINLYRPGGGVYNFYFKSRNG